MTETGQQRPKPRDATSDRFGGFRTPAPLPGLTARAGPASETLHDGGPSCIVRTSAAVGRVEVWRAVAVGRIYPLPLLSSGGASLARPWLRFRPVVPERGLAGARRALGSVLQALAVAPAVVGVERWAIWHGSGATHRSVVIYFTITRNTQIHAFQDLRYNLVEKIVGDYDYTVAITFGDLSSFVNDVISFRRNRR